MRRPVLPALTGVRFFAALYVILFHSIPDHPYHLSWELKNVVNAGHVAVGLFFVLSGFILVYNYAPATDAKRFWVARVARIYPIYVFSLLLELPRFVQVLLQNHPPQAALTIGSSIFFATLMLVQAWLPWMAYQFNWASWSISTEALFYLVFPFVLPYVVRKRASTQCLLACAAWVVSICVIKGLDLALLSTSLARNTQFSILLFNPLLRLPEFIMGMALGALFTTWQAAGHHLTPAAQRLARVTTYGALLAITICAVYSSRLPVVPLHTSLLAPLFAVLILSLASVETAVSKILSHPMLVLLGEASYGMYILHVPLHAWLRGADLLFHTRLYESPVWIPLYVLVVIGFSVFTFRRLEEPARDSVRRLLTPRAPRNTVPIIS